MSYKANPLDTAKGRSGSYYGQKEVEAAEEDGNIRVMVDSTVRKVGSPTGAGVNTAKAGRGVVAPWDDKASYQMEQLIGKP